MKKLFNENDYLDKADLTISLLLFGNILPRLQFELLDKFEANCENDIIHTNWVY